MPVRIARRSRGFARLSTRWYRACQAGLVALAPFLILALAWMLTVSVSGIPPILLPGPMAVIDAMIERSDLLFLSSVQTLSEILLATVIAVLAGFMTALLLATSSLARRALFPYVLTTQVLPKVALAPILVAWFGIGLQSRVVLAVLIAYFPMVINTMTGILGTREANLRYARSLVISEWQVLTKVRLPEALPSIIGGIKITAGAAVIGIVVGEFVAAEGGLGKVIVDSGAVLNTALMIAATILIAAIGLGIIGALEVIDRRVIYWQVGR